MNKYLEKMAMNAIGRHLNSATTVADMDPGIANHMPNAAKQQAFKNRYGNHVGMSVDGNAAGASGAISSSTAAKAFGNADRGDALATPIHERLKAHRASLGLADPKGDRMAQIGNAQKMRGSSTGVAGSGPSAATRANGMAANKAMVDARGGAQTALHLNGTTANVGGKATTSFTAGVTSSARPHVTPQGFMGRMMGKVRSMTAKLPMGKIAGGAALAGAGLLAHRAMTHHDNDQYQYQGY